MATLEDICVSAALNLLSTLTFLVASGIWRLQPFNGRVYFPKCITDAQPELINHGGLDSAVYIRINLLGFGACQLDGKTLESAKKSSFGDIDKLSIYHLDQTGSDRESNGLK
ncbi:hypothetical protein L6164_034581 [Bauhinia variegata]|uniref:Uncharacterized protein n=1 Tax=Bauhinia variegata TaxID=167791 RepID=A0ACB9KVY6_BAUVA|nr:hypothetical protein L6164_034581 [Bauhinia variegata]